MSSENNKNTEHKKEIVMEEVPIWHKTGLTAKEASAYTGIGENRLREYAKDPQCPFIFFIGKKMMFKRKELDEFISNSFYL